MNKEKEIKSIVLCRNNQVDFLISLLGQQGDCVIPSLFIYGLPSTGKTFTITNVVQGLGHMFVKISCIECYSSKLIFESIIEQIQQKSTLKKPNEIKSIINNGLFIQYLKENLNENQSLYILFQNSERLRTLNSTILPLFLKLNEISQLNVGIILESNLCWEKFSFSSNVKKPFIFYFNQYTKDEILTILTRPSHLSSSLYLSHPLLPPQSLSCFIQLILDTFYLACRNLKQLHYIAKINLPHYVKPIEKNEIKNNDIIKLFKNIEDNLKVSLNKLYLRENIKFNTTEITPNSDSNPSSFSSSSFSSLILSPSSSSSSSSFSRHFFELPVYSKYLLIAAYLASYNPSSIDKQLFLKQSTKNKKKGGKYGTLAAKKLKNERTSCQLLGPKYFPLERLLVIFYSIIEEKVLLTSIIFVQISSLVSLGLLSSSSSSSSIENQKFKCLTSLEQITAVSKSVGFEILRYLYDFL